MNILLQTIEKLPQTAALKEALANNCLPCSLARVANGAKQHLARSISGKRDVFFVCATEYEARQRFSEYIYGNKILLPAPGVELRPVETRGEETAFCAFPRFARCRAAAAWCFYLRIACCFACAQKSSFMASFSR